MIKAVGAVAAGLGYLTRFVLFLVQIAPVTVGIWLVYFGLKQIYPPVAQIVAGLAIIVLWASLYRGRTRK